MPFSLLRYAASVTSNPSSVALDAPEQHLILMLAVFFADIPRFMEALRLSGAIISGSFVLAFILGVEGQWQFGDLDVFVDSVGADIFVKFLVEEAGYSVLRDFESNMCVVSNLAPVSRC